MDKLREEVLNSVLKSISKLREDFSQTTEENRVQIKELLKEMTDGFDEIIQRMSGAGAASFGGRQGVTELLPYTLERLGKIGGKGKQQSMKHEE